MKVKCKSGFGELNIGGDVIVVTMEPGAQLQVAVPGKLEWKTVVLAVCPSTGKLKISGTTSVIEIIEETKVVIDETGGKPQ